MAYRDSSNSNQAETVDELLRRAELALRLSREMTLQADRDDLREYAEELKARATDLERRGG